MDNRKPLAGISEHWLRAGNPVIPGAREFYCASFPGIPAGAPVTVAINNNGGTCTTAGLTLGSHNITADYSGDTQDAAANSAVLVQVPVVVVTPVNLDSIDRSGMQAPKGWSP